MKNKAILLTTQDGDWEALYINGELIDEGHQLGEGRSEFFWLNIGEKYQIKGDDLKIMELNDADNETAHDYGTMPRLITHLSGEYSTSAQRSQHGE